ncbi:hypothetical protein EV356DRAFT_51767 [Viridothelium virens]|uniref:Uncharacterized protein n=1 Tax=Viridothelium virens TaxID=1048519 RepID=A0A6A6HG32_VIRVR|nr:hypothetical protein EV356DRAFT_51767 [Viridothelium virens]
MIMRGVFLFCLSALAASTQAVVVKPPGVNDPDTDAWLGGIEVPSHKPAMLPGSSNNGSCAGQKPPLWPPDQKEDYDRDAKLDVTPNAKGGSNSQRIFKRDQIESFYCGPHRKNIPKQVIGYGYTRYQVEQAFQDAEVFLRFWEPQRGHDLRSSKLIREDASQSALFLAFPKHKRRSC